MFWKELYNNQGLQSLLDKEIDIPPYTQEGSLLLYLLCGNQDNLGFIVNAKDSLAKYLKKNNIDFQYSDVESDKYTLLLEVCPKWLNLKPEYFSKIPDTCNKTNKEDIKKEIKEKIKSDFISVTTKLQWLQEPDWQFEEGKPLIFIGEIDMSKIGHDTARVYVFYNQENNSFTCVRQST